MGWTGAPLNLRVPEDILKNKCGFYCQYRIKLNYQEREMAVLLIEGATKRIICSSGSKNLGGSELYGMYSP